MHQKLELNNAIEKLLDPEQQFDREVAMRIIEFMKSVEFEEFSLRFGSRTKGNKFTGFTQEQGNVTIEDDKTKTQEYSFGDKKIRVGKYKLWKMRHKNYTFKIGITPFWASETTTRVDEEPPDEYFLFYNEKPEKLSLGRVVYEKPGLYDIIRRRSLILLTLIVILLSYFFPFFLRLILETVLGVILGILIAWILFNVKLKFNLRKTYVSIIKGDNIGQKSELGFYSDVRW